MEQQYMVPAKRHFIAETANVAHAFAMLFASAKPGTAVC
jgi:hypothetical protein